MKFSWFLVLCISMKLSAVEQDGHEIEMEPLAPSETQVPEIERTVFEKIILPHEDIKNHLKKRGYLSDESLIFNQINNEQITYLGKHLTEQQVNDIHDILCMFLEYLKAEEHLRHLNDEQRSNVLKFIVIGGPSAAVGILSMAITGWLEFLQFTCVKTVCDDPQAIMIKTHPYASAEAPNHYCTNPGEDAACLSFQHNILGHEDLNNHHTYESGCNNGQNPDAGVGNEIPLLSYHKVFNHNCQALVGVTPLWLPVAGLIPGAYYACKSAVTAVKTFCQKEKILHMPIKNSQAKMWDYNVLLGQLAHLDSDVGRQLRSMIGALLQSTDLLISDEKYVNIFSDDKQYKEAQQMLSQSWCKDMANHFWSN